MFGHGSSRLDARVSRRNGVDPHRLELEKRFGLELEGYRKDGHRHSIGPGGRQLRPDPKPLYFVLVSVEDSVVETVHRGIRCHKVSLHVELLSLVIHSMVHQRQKHQLALVGEGMKNLARNRPTLNIPRRGVEAVMQNAEEAERSHRRHAGLGL